MGGVGLVLENHRAPFSPHCNGTFLCGRPLKLGMKGSKQMDWTVIDLLQIVIVAVTGLGVLFFSA